MTSGQVEKWIRQNFKSKADFFEWLEIESSTFYRWKKANSYPRYIAIIMNGEQPPKTPSTTDEMKNACAAHSSKALLIPKRLGIARSA